MDEQWYPEPSQEQKDAAAEQERKVVTSMPVLQDVLDWFDRQIAVYSDPRTITGIGINSDPDEVKQAVLFAQSLINDYEKKRATFANDFAKYITEVAEVADAA